MSKILLFDIETMASTGFVWGKYQQDVIEFEQYSYMLAFAYKWLDEKKAHVVGLPDFKGYKKDRTNDKELCRSLWELLDEAEIVCGHNSDKFDIKKANARFAYYNFKPYSPFNKIDTLKVARKHFKFESNKLDDLGDYLRLGRKVTHTGFKLWKDCADGKMKAWRLMKKYNKQDVMLLEKVYLHLRPWMDNHPNYNVHNETVDLCPACGGHLHRRGFRITRARRYQRFQCQKCGAWSAKPIFSVVR